MKEELYPTKVFKHKGCTFTVYQVKTKNILLLSTMSSSTIDIDNGQNSKPETIKFHNSAKFGVNVVDQRAKKYTVNAASCRWCEPFSYNILDWLLLMPAFYVSWLLGQMSHVKGCFCSYLKSFVQDLLMIKKLAHFNSVH